jgi:sugar-specific transcriptional regulator TrmB
MIKDVQKKHNEEIKKLKELTKENEELYSERNFENNILVLKNQELKEVLETTYTELENTYYLTSQSIDCDLKNKISEVLK